MGGEQCNSSNSNNSNLPWMMDRLVSRETELEVDFESGGATNEEDGTNDIVLANNQGGELVNTFWSQPLSFHSLTTSSKFFDVAEENVELLLDKTSEGEECQQHVVFVKKKLVEEKQKQKKKDSRKAPKPPRPPQGPSLDAADQKLVQEIAELAMRKRARAERIKMLKKMRAAKSSSWNGTLCGMVVTVIFFVIIIFQGICARSKGMNLQGSPQPAIGAKEDMIAIEFFNNSDLKSDGPGSNSPNMGAGQVSGSSKR